MMSIAVMKSIDMLYPQTHDINCWIATKFNIKKKTFNSHYHVNQLITFRYFTAWESNTISKSQTSKTSFKHAFMMTLSCISVGWLFQKYVATKSCFNHKYLIVIR